MRLVKVSNDHIGKILAHSIYTNKGLVFMKSGITLTQVLIERIQNLGLVHMYIDDEFAGDISIELTFSDNSRLEILQELQTQYQSIQKTHKINEIAFLKLTDRIVREINVNENAVLPSDCLTNDEISKIAVHCLEVAVYCVKGFRTNPGGTEAIKKVVLSALLHECGKLIGAEDPVRAAFEMVKGTTNLAPTVYTPILHIHENLEDSLTANPNKGNTLFLNSQILNIANDYSNLLDQTQEASQALEILIANSPHKYDEAVFKSMTKIIYCYPTGLVVELSDGNVGIVCRQNTEFPARPVLILKTSEVLNLVDHPTVFVTKILI